MQFVWTILLDSWCGCVITNWICQICVRMCIYFSSSFLFGCLLFGSYAVWLDGSKQQWLFCVWHGRLWHSSQYEWMWRCHQCEWWDMRWLYANGTHAQFGRTNAALICMRRKRPIQCIAVGLRRVIDRATLGQSAISSSFSGFCFAC